MIPPALTVNVAVDASATWSFAYWSRATPSPPSVMAISNVAWICASVSRAVRSGRFGVTPPTAGSGSAARLRKTTVPSP